MKRISRRSFLMAAGLGVAALGLAACGGAASASTAASASSAASGSNAAAESDLDDIKGKGKMVIGYTVYEPMNYTDADGNFTGFDTELATAVCEKLGVEPEFVEINWDTKVVELDAKSIDCIRNGMTLTDDIIKNGGFRLYDDFYQLFKIPGKLCDESLFECQVTDYGNGSGDYLGVDQWFNFQGPNMAERYDEVVNADGTISYKQAEGTKSIGGWNFIGYEPEFVAWAEARGEGVRAETSFLKALSKTREGWQVGPTSATKTDCWNGKGYLPYNQMTLPRTTYGANNNVRIIRYAEVLLMNSEAKVRLGKDGDAGYNEVRRRAGMSTKTGVTLKDVMDERRMELCGEWCARYVDLVRTGDAATVLGPKGWTAEKTDWPIPANQLDDLPDLKLEPIDGIAE